nr:hypothetical protein [Micromonospora sp. DSM 115978]
IPSFVAFAVVGLLEEHFGRLVDYRFTASMEDDLDHIAAGDAASIDYLTRFYFGATDGRDGGIGKAGGLKHLVDDRLGERGRVPPPGRDEIVDGADPRGQRGRAHRQPEQRDACFLVQRGEDRLVVAGGGR